MDFPWVPALFLAVLTVPLAVHAATAPPPPPPPDNVSGKLAL
jgi:hypothetical protein